MLYQINMGMQECFLCLYSVQEKVLFNSDFNDCVCVCVCVCVQELLFQAGLQPPGKLRCCQGLCPGNRVHHSLQRGREWSGKEWVCPVETRGGMVFVVTMATYAPPTREKVHWDYKPHTAYRNKI